MRQCSFRCILRHIASTIDQNYLDVTQILKEKENVSHVDCERFKLKSKLYTSLDDPQSNIFNDHIYTIIFLVIYALLITIM